MWAIVVRIVAKEGECCMDTGTPWSKYPKSVLVIGALLAAILFAPQVAQSVTIEMVPVGGAGNTCNTSSPQGCFGAVPYDFEIGKYEVTWTEYAAFLNAVATTDTYLLFRSNMWVCPDSVDTFLMPQG